MAFYEVVGRGEPSHTLSARDISEADEMANTLFSTGKYDRVFIRQYFTDRNGFERYRVLRSKMKILLRLPVAP